MGFRAPVRDGAGCFRGLIMALRLFTRAPVRVLACAFGVVLVASSLASPAEARHRHGGHHRVGNAASYAPPFSAMVVDAKTGRVLMAQNEDELRHPASITKVMTLYLLFEQLERGRYRLDSPLTVTGWAERQAPSKLGLRAGQTIEVEAAIRALVTKSANDVAVTVAENIGGSEQAFAEMMTRKARQLGMSRTVYRNASGLPDEDQVTTARDLITLGRAIQERFPVYYRYFSTASFAWHGAVHRNHNKLLGRVEGVDGIKTGYTRMSGFNLLTSAKSGNRQILAVILGGRSGAARDRMMADLVETHLERAYAGAKTVAPVADAGAPDQGSDVSRLFSRFATASAAPAPAPAPKAEIAEERPQPVTTAAIVPIRPKAPEAPVARAAVASATGGSATTPSATLRWKFGPAPAAPAKAPDATVVARADLSAVARPSVSSAGGWMIQLAATEDEQSATAILQRARAQGKGVLAKASPYTEKISKGGSTLYRARFTGFTAEDAQSACKTLSRSGFSCFPTKG
jgi:D-alanyl-D-alanine carboxypeptidase